MDLHRIQETLRERKLDGWLFCDFHQRDHLAYRILGLDARTVTTRRWFYFVPVRGTARRLVHGVEPTRLDALPGSKTVYRSWEELHAGLKRMLGGPKRIAMQYSPKNNIPTVSLVDAGTLELVRSLKHRVVSSADLVQIFEALIDAEGYRSHKEAGTKVDRICAEAFERIRRSVASGGGATTFQVQRFILERIRDEGLAATSPPIVGTNDQPANPHFEPTPENARGFKPGDSVLIDLWAKLDRPRSIYYDITWVGCVGEPAPMYRKIFEASLAARDAGIAFVKDRYGRGTQCRGYEVDQACRAIFKKAGFMKYVLGRSGHSIGEEVHGNGVNLDSVETRDDRVLMPGCLFSVEPGLYLAGRMAVRSEVNIFLHANGEAEVTGEVQRELVRI